eukprot:2524297-Prymnesium_polylepis.1
MEQRITVGSAIERDLCDRRILQHCSKAWQVLGKDPGTSKRLHVHNVNVLHANAVSYTHLTLPTICSV